jgi:4a-hydroxytetrahydrobiopterin dehydratase
MTRLTQEQLDARLKALPGWVVQDGLLTKIFSVRSYAHGVLFIAAIGQFAEASNHHPDVSLRNYNQVMVSLVTHSEGGLTEKDLGLAEQIEALPHKAAKPG